MSTNTKVLLWGIIAISMTLMITVMHFIITREANLTGERRTIAMDIARDSLDLSVISEHLASDQSDSVLKQWELTYNSISASMMQLKDDDAVAQTSISVMNTCLVDLRAKFDMISFNVDAAGNNFASTAEKEGLSREIIIITHTLVENAASLSDHMATHVRSVFWQSSAVITVSLMVLIIIIGLFWATIARQTKLITKASTELTSINKELEAFSYSVSHDLRAPLRNIEGFSQALMESYSDKLDDQGKHYLKRVNSNVDKMGELIDDLLKLSRITLDKIKLEMVNLSPMANSIAAELQRSNPERSVEFSIQPGLNGKGDEHLIRILLENLMSNAWKYTSKHSQARIEFGATQVDGKQVFHVRDNGAGFDMTYADKLFAPFQRLHSVTEFPGIGIGLATVQRIVHRHGGQVWAEGEINRGATFYFTLS